MGLVEQNHQETNKIMLRVLWDSWIITFNLMYFAHVFCICFIFLILKRFRANKTKLKAAFKFIRHPHPSESPAASEPQHATVSHFRIWLWGTSRKSSFHPCNPPPLNHGHLKGSPNHPKVYHPPLPRKTRS